MFEDDVFHIASGEAFKNEDKVVTVIHRIRIEKRGKNFYLQFWCKWKGSVKTNPLYQNQDYIIYQLFGNTTASIT